jgi:periplasmic protein TonB
MGDGLLPRIAMAPLSKDTVAVANPSSESTVSKASVPAKSTSGHLRADAVSLEVAVKVHGSRVTEAARGATPHTDPFEEETATMIVFPQGGVVRMSSSVSVGQMLVLTNLKSRQDAICRVVKVRTFSKLQGYVEVEFTHAQPGYWGVYFPSDGPAPQNKPAASTLAAAQLDQAPPATMKEKFAQDISWSPAPQQSAQLASQPAPNLPNASSAAKDSQPADAPHARFVPSPKPTSTFVSIGSQEDVQVAASATVTTKASPPAAAIKGIAAQPAAPTSAPSQVAPVQSASAQVTPAQSPRTNALVDFPAVQPPTPSPSLSMAELLGDENLASRASSVADATDTEQEEEESAAVAAAPVPEGARHTFGSFAGGATLDATKSASSDTFAASAEESVAGQRSWVPVALGIGLMLACVAGGVSYFRSHVVNNSAGAAAVPSSRNSTLAPTSSNVRQPEAVHSAASQPSSPSVAAASPVTPVASNPVPESSAAAGSATKTNSPAPAKTATSQPIAPAKSPAAGVTSAMVASALNAHPTATQRADASQSLAEPSVDVAPASENTAVLPGAIGSSDAPPPPEVKPEAAVKVGGDVKGPRLISSTLPLFPTVAKEAGITGDVVIRASIDKKGDVGHMEIVSGPPMLHQAALQALRRWKYQPATLDGEPIDTQILVTVKFHR